MYPKSFYNYRVVLLAIEQDNERDIYQSNNSRISASNNLEVKPIHSSASGTDGNFISHLIEYIGYKNVL